jgi:hypothetical protein
MQIGKTRKNSVEGKSRGFFRARSPADQVLVRGRGHPKEFAEEIAAYFPPQFLRRLYLSLSRRNWRYFLKIEKQRKKREKKYGYKDAESPFFPPPCKFGPRYWPK